MDNIPSFRHPGEFILVIDKRGKLFRYTQHRPIPEGFEEVFEDNAGKSFYDHQGTLRPKYWTVEPLALDK